MKVELIAITSNAEELIEICGRTCYQSKVGDPKIIKAWIKSGHESVIEHASATFRISGISRACSHQLVRHRVASFSQMSQRYVKENQFEYVTPKSISHYSTDDIVENTEAQDIYKKAMEDCQKAYNELCALGIKKEDARMVLPNACCTEIIMTANFREWRHIFKLRLDEHAQWEIRELFKIIYQELYAHAPRVFGDLEELL